MEVGFDKPRAQYLVANWEVDGARCADLLQQQFPPLWETEMFVPKRNNKTKGYEAGVPFPKRTLVPYNPGSSQQTVARFAATYGWTPTMLTETGAPAMNAAVLKTMLEFPEAQTLLNSKLISKRISMATGDAGWLNNLSHDGRLHTQYFSHGTVTGRATHKPNISQVPRVVKGKDGQPLLGLAGGYGYECRSLFGPTPGWWMVGADQKGLELRCLAHALAPFDDGEYARIVCDGDPHSLTQQATGLASRDKAKTMIYATIFGGGDYRIGTIIEPNDDDHNFVREIGHAAKRDLIEGIPGFAALFRWLDRQTELIGLDGRILFVRKKYAMLNTLLQSTGAILCKRWLVLIAAALDATRLVKGADYQALIWNHDEVQYGARTREIAEMIAHITVEMAVQAGLYYNFQCPTEGEAKIGRNWAETH